MIRKNIIFFALGLICITTFPTTQAVGNTKFREAFAWRELTFNWTNDAMRDQDISTGTYVPENNLPLGLAVWKDKIFVTVPRWKSGVASSLNYIKKDGPVDQPLTPYPDWTSNRLVSESDVALDANVAKSRIISTFRVWPDACDRLWLVDSGLADVFGQDGLSNEDKQAPKAPKIMVFDLNTDKLLLSYDLKSSDYKDDSFFANIIVDVDSNKCDDAFAYLPDLGGYGVVVYDWRQGESWRITHHYFHMDPLDGDYNVGNVQFHWTDGIFSLALGSRDETGYRPIYFHPLSSTKEFEVNSRILQNKTLADESFDQYKLMGTKGPDTQATASIFHEKSGILFYTQINRNGVGCWNSKNKFNPSTQGIVTSDPETFIFPNDLKIDSEDNIWVLTDKLPIYVYKSLNSNEINYRIFTAPVDKVVKDTIC